MVKLARTFTADTQTISRGRQVYAGQKYDSGSIELCFTYDPKVWFEYPDDGGGKYTPYIIFDVTDGCGNLLIFGGDTEPSFDGYDFIVPYIVTSRMTTDRLDYQLAFVRRTNDLEDDTPPGLGDDDVEIAYSNKDRLYVKPSIHRGPDGAIEPTAWGAAQFVKRFGAGMSEFTIPARRWKDCKATVDEKDCDILAYTNESSSIMLVPESTSTEQIEAHGVNCVAQGNHVLDFTCDTAPDTSLKYHIIARLGKE